MVDGIDSILGKGKFAIKAWHSNSPEIDQDGNENPVSLLGHQWNKKADSIVLKSETVYTDLSYCTKRKALGVVFQLWDPLGLMAPVTIRFRIDLQNLWAAGYQWNELLPPEEKLKWQKNVEIMNALLGTHLERCLKPETSVGSPQLHGFSDAGELGYCGALFLRCELALVEEVFPGGDNLVRKVKIRTSKGVYERPIAKLCLIATRQELEQNATLVQHS